MDAALMLLERAAAQSKLIIDATADRAMTTLLVLVRYRSIPRRDRSNERLLRGAQRQTGEDGRGG